VPSEAVYDLDAIRDRIGVASDARMPAERLTGLMQSVAGRRMRRQTTTNAGVLGLLCSVSPPSRILRSRASSATRLLVLSAGWDLHVACVNFILRGGLDA
jgi:hypothetical protein